MKSRLYSFVFASCLLGLVACSDDSSSGSADPASVGDGKFYCKVSSGRNWARQEIKDPASGVVSTKVTVNGGEVVSLRIEDLDSLDDEEFLNKCDSLKGVDDSFDYASLLCEDHHIEYSITRWGNKDTDISDIVDDMEEDCGLYEEEYLSRSSSSKRSSSSSATSSSSVKSSSSARSSSSRESLSSEETSSSRNSSSSASTSSSRNEAVSNCIDSECFEDFENFKLDDDAGLSIESSVGVEGSKALSLTSDSYVAMPWNLDDTIQVGSLDFYYKPGLGFETYGSYALVSNDGARMSVLYSDGTLYFYKNHTNIYVVISGEVNFERDEWYRITAEWNAELGYIALFLDGKQIAFGAVENAYYSPSDRGSSENTLQIGYKSGCCMNLLAGPLYAKGMFDNVQVTTENIFEIVEPIEDVTEPEE